MEVKETTNILEGFTDIEESFKTELKVIGTNSLLLLEEEEVFKNVVLNHLLNAIIQDVFKIYISTENLEDFLSVDPTDITKHDKVYLNNFLELKTVISIMIITFNTLAEIDIDKIKPNADSSITKPIENIVNSKNALEYFLEQFKEVHEYLINDKQEL